VGAYALAKQACEDLLLAQHDLAVTVVRPTYSMSDKFVISIFNHQSVALMRRLLRGEPVVLPDGGTSLIHPSDSRDTGRMIGAIAGEERTYGKTYTVGSEGVAMPQRDYISLIARVDWSAGAQCRLDPAGRNRPHGHSRGGEHGVLERHALRSRLRLRSILGRFPEFPLAAGPRRAHRRVPCADRAGGAAGWPTLRDLEAIVLKRCQAR
jgi:nucleoside-diphosphate-sugar epimerase